jgi:hypothetical protein
VRYADDFLLGFVGPKAEAEEIKRKLTTFLQEELKLELSQEKTLITHAQTERARFLGYDIVARHEDTKHDRLGRRGINRSIGLRIPAEVIEARCREYMKQGKPIHRPELEHNDDYSIIAQFQAEYRGYVQYYLLAENVGWLTKLHWVMERSLLKTLAHKHKTSAQTIAKKYAAKRETAYGPRACLMAQREIKGKKRVAYFGGIPLRQDRTAIPRDQTTRRYFTKRTEIVQRLLADTCELCGSPTDIEVHHVRKLADLKTKSGRAKSYDAFVMAARQRKTLVLCRNCHRALHAGRLQRKPRAE